MQRVRLLTFTSLAVLASCAPPDAALRVNVTVRTQGTARVRADCVRLTISNDTQELKSLTIKRPADDEAVFAVRRGSDLPATVKVQATGYLGNCADDSTLKLNAQGESVSGVFPESGVTELAVFLDPPGTALDSDRDGYVAAGKGGLDCKDDDNTIFPGAGQVCANTGDTDCDGQGGCDDSECGSAAVCADPADRVQITTSIATMLRYECRGPFRVELRNAMGPRLAIRDTAVALTSSLAGVTVHGVASCTDMPLSALPIPYGQSFFEVYLKADGQAFGINTLTATAAQVATPGRAMVEVHPQPLDHLVFTTPPRTVSAGQCSAETVDLEFRDAMNRRTDVDAPTTITLASAPGDLNNANIFFSDAACGTDGSMQQLQPGQGAISLHLKAGRAGTFTLTATPSAGQGQTQPLTVQPAGATQLAFTNNPLVLSTTQSCSAGQFTVQVQDQFQNPVIPSTDLPIRMTVSGLSGVQLFEAGGLCTSAAQTDFTIPAGFSTVSVRARGLTASATAGEIRAAVLNGAPITDATQPLRISAGFASKFILTGSAQSPLANVCSANPFSVALLDSADNPASSSTAVAFALTTLPTSDPSFRFYAGAGCQTDLGGTLSVPAGQTSAQFYYRGNKAVANFEIRASSTLTAPATFLPGNSIRPAAPGKLLFGSTPPYTAVLSQSAQAGVCTPSTYVATVLDLFDNPTSFTAPQTVTVASTPAGVTVGASTCNVGNSVTLAAGSSQVAFTAQHTVTSPTTPYALTASVGGFSTPTPANLNVTPGPSTLQVDTPLGGNVSLAAGACQQITLTRRDAFNNNAPTSGATAVTLSFPAMTNWLVYASNNCSGTAGASIAMNSTHTVTFSVSPRTSGTHQMSATIPGPQTALVNFTVSAAAPTLVFEAPNTGTGTAAATQTVGGCTLVTVARKDTYGNDVPLGSAQNLTFTLPTGTTAHTGTPCTSGNAVTSIALNATDARATFYVSATRSLSTGGPVVQTVLALLASQSANLSLTVNPGAPLLSVVVPTSGTATITANQCQPVTVERRDSYGNLVPVSGATNLTIAPAGLSLFTATDCTGSSTIGVAAGASSRAFSVRTTTAAAATAYTISLDGQTVPLNLTVNPGPTTQFVVQGLPANSPAGSCIGALTLRRRDQWNNDTTSGAVTVAMTSSQFQFAAAAGCAGATTGADVAIADTASVSSPFYATATVSGVATMTATLGSATGTGNVTITVGAPILSVLVPTGGTATITANQCQPVTVERRDSYGNPVPVSGATNLTIAPAGLSLFSATDCTGSSTIAVAAGASSRAFSVRTNTAAASTVYTITLAGQTVPLTLTVNPGPTTQLVVQGLPGTLTSGACTTGPITLRRRDQWNNDTTSGVVSVTMTSSQFTFSAAADCSAAASTLQVGIADTSAVSSQFYATATAAGTATMTATLGSVTGTGSLTVVAGAPAQLVFTTPSRTFTAGVCGGSGNVITVQLRDAAGNPANATTGGQAFTAASSSVGGAWFTNASCGAAAAGGNFTIPSGSNTVSLYYRDSLVGTPSVSLANGSGLINPAPQSETVNVGVAAKLVFITPARTFTAAQCPGPGVGNAITVQLQDAPGNPVNAGAGGRTFTASSNSTGTVSWYTDDTCGPVSASGSFTIPSGSNSVSIFYQDTKAGTPSISLANSTGLANPTPQVETVVVGAPAKLTFTTAPQSVPALGCSGATTVTLQDLGGNTVTTASDRVVTFSATPAGANTTFYSDASCATPLTGDQLTMTNGTSSVTMRFKAENPNTITLTAATAPLTSGTQNETITAALSSKLAFTTAPSTVEAGYCLPVTVERQDSLSRPTNPNTATAVTLTASPSTGVSFFTNAICTTALGATFNIPANSSNTTVYVKGISGSLTGVIPGTQLYTLTAAASGLTSGTLDVTVQPMVRRRSAACGLSGAASVACPISPALSDITRTILFFQATPNSADNPADENVTCRLRLNTGVAEVFCERVGNGSGNAAVTIEWQTVSFAYPSTVAGGVSVQHVTAGCVGTSGVMPVDVATTAPRANSFVLFSSRTDGTDNDGEHFFTAQLTSDTNLRFGQSASGSTVCTRTVDFVAQVVTWNGATVVRGVTAPVASATSPFTAATTQSGNTFLLYSSRMTGDTGGGNNICRRRLRGEVTSATLLTFARGCDGADIQDISWEHVKVPTGATVQQVTGTTGTGNATVGVTFSSVDLTRSVVFMGGQGPGGSATGSTTYATNDRVGTALAQAVVTSATGATYTRVANDVEASFTGFVLQLAP